MKESFNKFKKRILLEALIKSAVFGLSSGLIAFSVPWIIIKLKKIDFNVLYFILIGLAVALVVFGILFLILKPSDKKVAKRLDNHFNLNEKVQTMVEYENVDNFMVNVQREDTLNILSNISIKNLSLKFGVLFFIFIFVACASSVTAFAIPGYEEPTVNPGEDEVPDPDYELDNWQIKAILGIIEVVEDSTIDDDLKTLYVAELNGLIEALKDADKQSEMNTLVTGVIDNVKLELDKVNTNNEIFSVLRESSNPTITQFGVKINTLNSEDVYNLFDIIAYNSVNEQAIAETDNAFGKLLRDSNLDKEDSLCKNLIQFCDDYKAAASNSDLAAAVRKAVDDNRDKVIDAILLQAENKEIADYIEIELNEIFGLNETEDDLDEDKGNQDSSKDEEDNKPDDNNNSGGLGTGEILFGSNDFFFDPEKGTVEYGDVITSYYGEIMGKLNDGTIPEEYREYLEQYFDILFGDFDKQEE